MPQFNTFNTVDHVLIALYFVIVIWVGFYAARKIKGTKDFFEAGGQVPWFKPSVIPSSQQANPTLRPCGRLRFWLGVICLCGMTGWANLLTAANDDGWRLLAGYLYPDAAEAFARNVSADERLRQLGQAASLLNNSPVTGSKIERAAAMLQNVLDKRTGDTTALYASYLLARIDHDYRETELGKAEAGYRAVIAAAPDHPLAQLAAAQLALVLLYQRPDLAVPARVAAAAELAPVAGGAHLPEVASTYYRLLADAAMFYDITDERVLGWLQQADAIGTHNMVVAATVRLQIAEVARILGRREQALTYYRRFLDGILPTDPRYLTATERMKELEGGRP